MTYYVSVNSIPLFNAATDQIVVKNFPSNKKCVRSRQMRAMEREVATKLLMEKDDALGKIKTSKNIASLLKLVRGLSNCR